MRWLITCLPAAFIVALVLGVFPAFAAGQRDTRNYSGNQTSIWANESALLRGNGFIYYRDGRPVLANGTTCVVPRAEMDGTIGDALLGQLEPYQMDGLPNCAPYGQVAPTPPQPCDVYGNCPPPYYLPAAIAIQSITFSPATVTVAIGTTVSWINQDPVQHTTTSDTGVWDSGLLNPGRSFTFTFTSAGTFTFHCVVHPFMHGTIQVVGSANPAPPYQPPPSVGGWPTNQTDAASRFGVPYWRIQANGQGGWHILNGDLVTVYPNGLLGEGYNDTGCFAFTVPVTIRGGTIWNQAGNPDTAWNLKNRMPAGNCRTITS